MSGSILCVRNGVYMFEWLVYLHTIADKCGEIIDETEKRGKYTGYMRANKIEEKRQSNRTANINKHPW